MGVCCHPLYRYHMSSQISHVPSQKGHLFRFVSKNFLLSNCLLPCIMSKKGFYHVLWQKGHVFVWKATYFIVCWVCESLPRYRCAGVGCHVWRQIGHVYWKRAIYFILCCVCVFGSWVIPLLLLSRCCLQCVRQTVPPHFWFRMHRIKRPRTSIWHDAFTHVTRIPH